MANDVYQIIMQGQCDGEFWETVQHYQSNGTAAADPASAALALINAFIGQAQDDMLAFCASEMSVTGYKAKRVNNGGGPTVMKPQAPAPGTQVDEPLLAAAAYCIVSLYSNGTKWRAGRWFIPGIPETYVTGNHYMSGAISAVEAWIPVMQSLTSSGLTFTFGIWSTKAPATFFSPAYVSLSGKIGIQRRRLLPVM